MLLSRHAAAVLAAGALRPAAVAGLRGAPAPNEPSTAAYPGVDADPAWAPSEPAPADPDPATLPLFGAPADDDPAAPSEPVDAPPPAPGHAFGARQLRTRQTMALSRHGPTDRPRRGVRPARRGAGSRHGARPNEVSVAQREREILALVQAKGPVVVEDIAAASTCGVSRIRAILANLVDVGALARAPQWNPAGGRPTYLYYDPASPDQVRVVQARTARPGRSA
jgi:hypothetical protein